MTEQTHTPGPWGTTYVAVQDGSGGECYYDIASEMRKIARLPGWGDVDAANARLMAAAPDLLDALRDLLQHMEGHHETIECDWSVDGKTGDPCTGCDSIAKARAAIKAAEGS